MPRTTPYRHRRVLRAADSPFATIEEALQDIAAGRMVVVVDDEQRENEGDLIMAGELVTADHINFMATHARGRICLALTAERCEQLGLELMTATNETLHQTPFTVTIEAREGVTTGISCPDRAHTIRTAIDPQKGPEDLLKGGHISPLKARTAGVFERAGHTEASVDLARLAGCIPAGVNCEILREDGEMARLADLVPYCAEHNLTMVTIADLIAYRRRTEKLVERLESTALITDFGDFTAVDYRSSADGRPHVALVKGEVAGGEDVLVRLHRQCLAGEVFHAARCDCAALLESSLARVDEEGRGVVVYLTGEHDSRPLIGSPQPTRCEETSDIGAHILADLEIASMRVLTSNTKDVRMLEEHGLSVTRQIPIEPRPDYRRPPIQLRSVR
jgi:3,4-dihydroxy 2-butanone 4-phosphate synthase/GTP cyclohydrolase II